MTLKTHIRKPRESDYIRAHHLAAYKKALKERLKGMFVNILHEDYRTMLKYSIKYLEYKQKRRKR